MPPSVILWKDGVAHRFLLLDYDVAKEGGQLDKASTLDELQLTTLRIKYKEFPDFVPVPFGTDGLSRIRIMDMTTYEVSGQAATATAAQVGRSLQGTTGAQAGGSAAWAGGMHRGSTGISELMKPTQEAFVLKFKVHNTVKRTRSTLKFMMDDIHARGRIRRESTTTVSATAIVSTQNQLEQFLMSLRSFADFSETAINDRPYILNPSLERVSLKLNPLVAEMFWKNGVQVDKMSTATRCRFADTSQASSDPCEAASTASSLPNSSSSINIPS